VIEHLPAARIATYAWSKSSLGLDVLAFAGMQDALFWFLDESWRVSKPGAEFRLSWPALRNDQTGEFCWAAFQDPTHYRFIPVEQVPYWSRAGRALYEVSQYRARCNWVSKPNYFQRLLGANVVENCFTFVKEP
jgi:hypothetical protein